MESLGPILSVVGLGLLFLSIGMTIKRTGDKSILVKFWANKEDLTKGEMIINRIGFVSAFLGILLNNTPTLIHT